MNVDTNSWAGHSRHARIFKKCAASRKHEAPIRIYSKDCLGVSWKYSEGTSFDGSIFCKVLLPPHSASSTLTLFSGSMESIDWKIHIKKASQQILKEQSPASLLAVR